LDKSKVLLEDEAVKLMAYCKRKARKQDKDKYKHYSMIISTLLETGIRASECRNLLVENLDLSDSPSIRVYGKGGRWRSIEISNRLKTQLVAYLEFRDNDSEYVFINRLGKPYSLCGIQYLFKRLCQECKIRSELSIHSTRHAFAFRLYAQTKDIRCCQELLGHRSISSTLIYAQISSESKSKAVNQLWR
jgi:integrase